MKNKGKRFNTIELLTTHKKWMYQINLLKIEYSV